MNLTYEEISPDGEISDKKARVKAGMKNRRLLEEVDIKAFFRFITVPVIVFS